MTCGQCGWYWPAFVDLGVCPNCGRPAAERVLIAGENLYAGFVYIGKDGKVYQAGSPDA